MKTCYIVRDEISGNGPAFKDTGTRVFTGRNAYNRAVKYAKQLVTQWRADFQTNPYADLVDKAARVVAKQGGYFSFHGRKAEVEEGAISMLNLSKNYPEVVKITVRDDGDPVAKEDQVWCLVVEVTGGAATFCTSEFFGYGEGTAVYKTKTGKVTCLECIARIKTIKKVKL